MERSNSKQSITTRQHTHATMRRLDPLQAIDNKGPGVLNPSRGSKQHHRSTQPNTAFSRDPVSWKPEAWHASLVHRVVQSRIRRATIQSGEHHKAFTIHSLRPQSRLPSWLSILVPRQCRVKLNRQTTV